MQLTTRRLSSSWSQVLKKSACMVDAPQGVVAGKRHLALGGGMGNVALIVSTGADLG
jgi:hypothetical protein